MKLKYYVVNPGGNITAIITGKFTKKLKLKINKLLLKNNPTLEQVGFWVAPKNKKADARLEMAGGEFCGNALRSLGAVLASQQKHKKDFLIESSGVMDILKATASRSKSEFKFPVKDIKTMNTVCMLPGISHIMTKELFTKVTAKRLLGKNKLLEEKAAGVISYKKEKNNFYKITPIVWVNEAKTLYEETACASGTLALAYMIYKKSGVKKLTIQQPSSVVFKTSINNKMIILGGPILNIEQEEIKV